jgi:tripeptidyl-peptidase-1
VPDVAALCTNFQVYSGGAKAGTLTGTSAATPTFAGLVATINDLRAKAGKKSVGFINPVLYAAGAKLGFDVTTGNNKNSGCKAGFPAQKGWDPVTGLGTPSFATLQDILNSA